MVILIIICVIGRSPSPVVVFSVTVNDHILLAVNFFEL